MAVGEPAVHLPGCDVQPPFFGGKIQPSPSALTGQGTAGIAQTFVCRTRFSVGTAEGRRLATRIFGNADDVGTELERGGGCDWWGGLVGWDFGGRSDPV